ncbi:carcinine transporter [Cimex lectularius]|uniref:Major facilitator superfamily (MFS) profile domain-containing protein n=1 Tax=Cimex lectularius TaxID=79782 RepID=A0A8I6SQU0_CIMLE|nr:carcinine transporter [Cimex lectularius]
MVDEKKKVSNLDANSNVKDVGGSVPAEEDLMDFDDLLPYIGEFGLYQKLLFLMMIPFLFSVAFVYFAQIFVTLVPEDHWCRVPELEGLPQELRMSLSIPPSPDGEGYDNCRVYVANWTDVIARGLKHADPSWPTIPCSKGWEYNYTDVPYSTIASELDWVCENAALPSFSTAVFFLGAITGGLVFGWMADYFGRIPALIGANLVGLVGGLLTAMATSFWTFTACRFLVGLAFDNCFTMMYILVLEYVGPKWRTFVANMSIALFFTLASCLLPWIALWIADWRWFMVVTSLPLAAALFTPCTVPESARWLVSQGKTDKAVKIIKKFEKLNGKKVDPLIYDEFKTSCEKAASDEPQSYSVLDLFRTPRLRNTTVLLIVIWGAISLTFDGHVRNVGSLGLDVFLTFTVAAATELPADVFLTFTLDRWGRRWLACISMVMSGLFSILATTVPVGIPSASLAIIGRFAVNISYNIGLQYAAELLPTVVRAQGVALIHIMGYVASIVSPFVVYLAHIDVNLPLFVLGAVGIFGGLLSMYLPETMDKELPQTLKDGEEFGKGQTMWDMPCVSKHKEPEPVPEMYLKRRSSSVRASVRGEHFRSSLINRSMSRRISETLEENHRGEREV